MIVGEAGARNREVRETVLAILEVEREMARRAETPLKNYNAGKIHKKQMKFHRCRKRNRWVFGGNRTGKTECGAVECVWLARGIHPYRENRPREGWVVSPTFQVQREVAQRKILKYLEPGWIAEIVMREGKRGSPEGILDAILVRNVFGSLSRIGFKSCDQGREKFQGSSLDYVWFDEEPDRDVYEECRMRVLDRKGELFGTMTPLKGLTFVYDQIFLNAGQDPEVWCEFMEWKDNPFLDRREVKRLAASMSEEERESRCFGRFWQGAGLVYREFDPAVHVVEPFSVPPEWQDTLSIDPGLNNPLSCHFYATDYDGNVYVVAEHYEAGREVAHHAREIKRIAATLGWHTDSRGRLCALIDSAASQRTLACSKSVVELFYEQGILVNPNVDKDVFAGISRVKQFLRDGEGKPRLFIFKNCVNLIRELKGYWWGKDDLPRKTEDHALDELRYYIMSKPRTPRREERVSELEEHRRKLERRARKGRR